MPINLIPLSFKIFPFKHKMFCKVKTFNLLYFSTAKYIFRNHQNNSYLKQVSKKRIPLSYKILPLSHKMFWKCDIIDILLIHSIKNTSGNSNAYMSSCLTSKGGNLIPITTLEGDFKNSKLALYFYHLGRPITKTMLIKTLFIFNQQ